MDEVETRGPTEPTVPWKLPGVVRVVRVGVTKHLALELQEPKV
jgi:hypothetical protein